VQSNFTDAEWARRESVLFPPKAVREGVLNALAHRDYALSGSILISIFRDSMEITNPGGLPDHLTPADLKKDHLSMPRNPDIAHVFFLRRLTEKVGRGTQRIVEDCRNARLKEPRWYTSSLQTRLTFFAPPSGSTMRGKFELNERQEKMLKFARDHARLKPSDLVKLFGSVVSDRTLRTDLQQLVQAGELMRRGRGRGISYVLDSKGA
jgi:ATP-dependent DNA helicase RecG